MGEDKLLIVHNFETKTILNSKYLDMLQDIPSAVTMSPEGSILAIGLRNGSIYLIDTYFDRQME